MVNRKFILLLISTLVLAVCLQGGILASGFFGISADESGRTLDAYTWLHTGIPQSDVWLPLYRILVGCGLLVWNDLFIVPRIISFLVGLLTIGALVWLAHELFSNRRVTMATAILAAFFPHRIILSVVPLSEIGFIALLVAGMASYVRWLNLDKVRYLFISALFIGLSTTARYEGWLFVPVFVLLLITEKENGAFLIKRPIAGCVIAFIIMAFPVYWIIEYFIRTHVLFGFLSANTERYAKTLNLNFIKIIWHNPLTQFIYHNGATFNLIGILSLVEVFRVRKQINNLIILVFIPLILFTLIELTGRGITSHNPWRVISLWSCLLIPFTSYWIIEYIDKPIHRMNIQRYGIPALILLAFIIQTMTLARTPVFTRIEYDLGGFLREKLSAEKEGGKSILIESKDWSYLNVIVASNMPERIIPNSGFDPFNPSSPILNPSESINVGRLVGDGFRFLVFKTKLYEAIQSNSSINVIEKKGEWIVYEIDTKK